ncbi:protein STIP1, partial [Haematococcus lacustris]
MQLAPHIMDGYYHKGFALFNLHDYAGAAHAFQEGLKLNPADKVLRQGFWDAVGLLSQNRSAAS